MTMLGLLLAMIGMDPVRGAPRFTLNIPPLYDGVGFIPVVMGLFGVGEILLSMEKPVLEIIKTKFTDLFPKRHEWKVSAGAIGRGTVIGFFLGVLAGGGCTLAHLKELAAGREPSDDPLRIAGEALNWSGLMGVFPDLWDPLSGLHEDLPRFSRYQSRSPAESLIGPTFGTITNLFGTAHDVLDGDLEEKDVHQLRRVLPFQNVFYLTRLFNAIEGEISEGVGAEGATTMTFTERWKETKPSKEARK